MKRDEFEKFVYSELGDVAVTNDGVRYFSPKVQKYWLTWQAAVASQASPTTAAMDLARSALREQAERIRVLEARIAELDRVGLTDEQILACNNTAPEDQEFSPCITAPDEDLIAFARQVLNVARAALNKEKP